MELGDSIGRPLELLVNDNPVRQLGLGCPCTVLNESKVCFPDIELRLVLEPIQAG